MGFFSLFTNDDLATLDEALAAALQLYKDAPTPAKTKIDKIVEAIAASTEDRKKGKTSTTSKTKGNPEILAEAKRLFTEGAGEPRNLTDETLDSYVSSRLDIKYPGKRDETAAAWLEAKEARG